MTKDQTDVLFANLAKTLDGDLVDSELIKAIYATDASPYREFPLGVAMPKSNSDLKKLIEFANTHSITLIPRAGGTSLAGQCVGSGLVVDVSKYLNEILEFNPAELWVRVQPGVIAESLNDFLRPHGLFFPPNTSTANRCTIAGMVGNNSAGSTSIKYGCTRDHVIGINAFLSDGSEVEFGPLSPADFASKLNGTTLESNLYRSIESLLSDRSLQEEILRQYPKPNLGRRNTGYALDELLKSNVFSYAERDFNFCRLLCGSEGTLAFFKDIKLALLPLPPANKLLVCAHFSTLKESLQAAVVALQHRPYAIELIDSLTLDCTKENLLYQHYRFFLKDDPAGLLVIELADESVAILEKQVAELIDSLKAAGLGYHFPVVGGEDMAKVWSLRKAGLGLMSNLPGDAKPVTVVEDTAVLPEDLPAFVEEFGILLEKFGLSSVHYGHAGAGELHLRPVLNLKDPAHRQLFRKIAQECAHLVKRYRGSLSGEHGDGRLRGEFVPLMLGEHLYRVFCELKGTWDPRNIFNRGKIVEAPPMDESLRYESGQQPLQYQTILNFKESGGVLGLAEQCTGSGDCRKLSGIMCPSYMASRDERDTTRARANVLREFLTRSKKENPFDHREIKEVLDLCLSCKGCKSECPSNVDMAALKAEFQYQYSKVHGVPVRAKFFAHSGKAFALASHVPQVYNCLVENRFFSSCLKRVLGIAPKRCLPRLANTTLRRWYLTEKPQADISRPRLGKVFFFCDEFINYLEPDIGIKAIRLLNALGYEVEMLDHEESARAHISKGLLEEAREIARANFNIFKDIVSEETPLVGIEPSAILGFRDEYPRLVEESCRERAVALGKNCLLIDEFLAREANKGRISSDCFTTDSREVYVHGHCHQKSLSSVYHSSRILSLPRNYRVKVIPSGCCGMAGSFGYEEEHYALSMKVGETVLFPAVREASEQALLAAPGTSCRQQIIDGTGRKAFHPVELLYDALVDK